MENGNTGEPVVPRRLPAERHPNATQHLPAPARGCNHTVVLPLGALLMLSAKLCLEEKIKQDREGERALELQGRLWPSSAPRGRGAARAATRFGVGTMPESPRLPRPVAWWWDAFALLLPLRLLGGEQRFP